MGLKNAFFGMPVTNSVYYICVVCVIILFFGMAEAALCKEMSFLLPVAVATALNISDSIDLSSLGEWLSTIREPSANVIGVEMDKEGIKTILSGDELPLWR